MVILHLLPTQTSSRNLNSTYLPQSLIRIHLLRCYERGLQLGQMFAIQIVKHLLHVILECFEIGLMHDGEIVVNDMVKEIIISGNQGGLMHEDHHQELMKHGVVTDEGNIVHHIHERVVVIVVGRHPESCLEGVGSIVLMVERPENLDHIRGHGRDHVISKHPKCVVQHPQPGAIWVDTLQVVERPRGALFSTDVKVTY